MRPTGGNKTTNREQEVARLSSDIKSLAKELKIPILLLCQLNRQAEQGGGKPKLSHLRESGAIEQDADMVFLLHRERETEAGITREEVLRKGIESELIVAKNRNGETGIVRLVFLPHFTRFENATRFGADDVPGDI
jgi:replicative DNA helicase